MPHQILAPVIVISINLPLAVWALMARPRDPAYRAFAAFGLALVVWNLGGALGWYAGPEFSPSGLDRETWLRLRAAWLRCSFLGACLVPPNMLHLALLARGRRWLPRLRPGLWVLALYVPAALMGLALDLDFVRPGAFSNSWRRAFYDTTDAGALTVLGVVGVYMLAALALCWPDARASAEDGKQATSMYRSIVAPWVIGVVAILLLGAVREERAPTAALWTMVVSQAAMFQMARLRMVHLEVGAARWLRLLLVVILVGAVVLLASVAMAWLFERKVSVETALVLTIALVGACHIYAAVMPKLDALTRRVASRDRPSGD